MLCYTQRKEKQNETNQRQQKTMQRLGSQPTTVNNRGKTKQNKTLQFKGAVNIYWVPRCIYYSVVVQNKRSRKRCGLSLYRLPEFQSWKRQRCHLVPTLYRLEDGSSKYAPIKCLLLKISLLQHTLPEPQFTVDLSCLSHEIRNVHMLRDSALPHERAS